MHAQFITQLDHKSSASQGAVTHRLYSVSVRETENSRCNYCSCRLHFKINLTFKRDNSRAWQIAAVGLKLVGVFETATSGVSPQRQVRKEMCFCRILEVLTGDCSTGAGWQQEVVGKHWMHDVHDRHRPLRDLPGCTELSHLLSSCAITMMKKSTLITTSVLAILSLPQTPP